MYIAVAVLWLMMVLFVCLFYWCCGLRIDLFSFVRLCFSCCGYLINRLFGFAIVVVLQSKSIYSISVRKFVQFVVRSILCCQSMDMSCFGKMIIEHDPSHWLYTFTHNIINNMFSVFFFCFFYSSLEGIGISCFCSIEIETVALLHKINRKWIGEWLFCQFHIFPTCKKKNVYDLKQ